MPEVEEIFPLPAESFGRVETFLQDHGPGPIRMAGTSLTLRTEDLEALQAEHLRAERQDLIIRELTNENARFWERIKAVLAECDQLRFSPAAREPIVQRLLGTIYETLAPKSEYVPVYSICGHDHTDDEPGVIALSEGYLTCQEGFLGYARPDLAEE
jgi:hypothetical protein